MKVRTPRWRVRILHILLLILISVSALPLWFFGQKMISTNQETLQREQNILQSNISRSLAKLISMHMENLREQLKDLFDDIVPLAARIPQDDYASSQVLRERLENFAGNNPDFLYLALVNSQCGEPGQEATMPPRTFSCEKSWRAPLSPRARERNSQATRRRSRETR